MRFGFQFGCSAKTDRGTTFLLTLYPSSFEDVIPFSATAASSSAASEAIAVSLISASTLATVMVGLGGLSDIAGDLRETKTVPLLGQLDELL